MEEANRRKEFDMPIHQCPRCELRFLSKSEVEWHLVEDHGSPPPESYLPAVIPRELRTFDPSVWAHSQCHR
jgi:hypothetical protein